MHRNSAPADPLIHLAYASGRKFLTFVRKLAGPTVRCDDAGPQTFAWVAGSRERMMVLRTRRRGRPPRQLATAPRMPRSSRTGKEGGRSFMPIVQSRRRFLTNLALTG